MPFRTGTTRLEVLITRFDHALRTLAAPARARRENPASGLSEAALSAEDRREAGKLMRVNHTGEVCAQALYQGQSLTARSEHNRAALERAAAEERDHLAWCEARIGELGSHTSLLNPLFYATSFALGAAAGAAGDRWSLAFVVETERQVEAHLAGHLERLSPQDVRTRAIVERMRSDEQGHGEVAQALGAASMPAPIRTAMRLVARVMTQTTYHV
jgi:ubiquinone biosynthesis monooxygenase Coq7